LINNNCGRLQDLILLFKIPKVKERIPSKIIDPLGNVPSKKFAGLGIGKPQN